MSELRRRVSIAMTRVATRLLRLMGVRDPLVRWRSEQRRAKRSAAEAVGDDRLSRPALHELDAKLNAIIDRDAGFFVEAGAHDGFNQSNTYWLERFRGWRGLLVEPIPELAAEARASRPTATVVQCALVSATDRRSHVQMRFGDLMSMVDGAKGSDWPSFGTVLGWRDPYEVDVPARTLSSLLDEIGAPEVDFLSLDVEGFEAAVLGGLDLDRHAPRYILLEVHNREKEQARLAEILKDRYTEYGWLSPLDVLYMRHDVASHELANGKAGVSSLGDAQR
ncbi:MAG TPA: FkbM family methyltransferase [Solirubrobacteraceae bacterium]|nr:FkbM family methyltransferase [Solirubrobacteraceae bacterium]